ncbi:hypothetical protein F5B17DRAFT_410979 [Nemania serpens]|nr:hypothetical protein F5B17DRAFT_410979 [Nemania serpens]
MCTEVYRLFSDPDCQHKEYQNTFPCHIVRRCHPDDDQLLKEPVFLPARPPNIPPGLLGCKVRKATRPMMGKCRGCSSQRSHTARQGSGNNNKVKVTLAPTSASLVGSAKPRQHQPSRHLERFLQVASRASLLQYK